MAADPRFTPPGRDRGWVAGRRLGPLLLLLALPACGAVREVDAAMRRVDVLDRVFAPAPASAPPAVEEPAPAPATVVEERAPEPMPEPMPEPIPDPEPEPPQPALAEPGDPPQPGPSAPADPASRTRFMVRQNPWLTRFWSELTPAQQQRVARRLRAAGREEAEPAAAWDGFGLGDRVRLIFGPGSASPAA